MSQIETSIDHKHEPSGITLPASSGVEFVPLAFGDTVVIHCNSPRTLRWLHGAEQEMKKGDTITLMITCPHCGR